jgi:ABC-type transporter Mla maintaining outer membrane lipid asymmetry ATPase subunit MlaF
VLFQQGALFSSLTALQNVQFPMREYLRLSPRLMDEIALAKLEMVGLRADVRGKYPAELSGGMIKRVALASIPTSSFSTSRPRASTRSAPPNSTSSSARCSRPWA